MKKLLVFCLVLVLVFIGCGKKEVKEEPLPKEKVTIKMYITPQVPFSTILSDLEKLGDVNFNKVLDNKKQPAPNTLDKIAFNLGAGVADALVGLKAKNKIALMNTTKELVKYAELLGVSAEFLRLSDSLGILSEQGEWDEIEQKLEEYKVTILDELYNMESYDSVILIQYGGWINGLQNVTAVLMEDIPDKEATKPLYNPTIITALLHDLPNLSDEDILERDYFISSLENVKSIKEIIFASKDGYFTKEDVKQLHDLAAGIYTAFSK